jgi:hypothetical protein
MRAKRNQLLVALTVQSRTAQTVHTSRELRSKRAPSTWFAALAIFGMARRVYSL